MSIFVLFILYSVQHIRTLRALIPSLPVPSQASYLLMLTWPPRGRTSTTNTIGSAYAPRYARVYNLQTELQNFLFASTLHFFVYGGLPIYLSRLLRERVGERICLAALYARLVGVLPLRLVEANILSCLLQYKQWDRCDIANHGMSWKQLFFERYISELVEDFGIYRDITREYEDQFVRCVLSC